ncbi:hypothetical protein HKBW3S06_01166 [Candidatus Hakubella thermalkaliphila]|uniref:DUF4214 domain-containing protein n=2 Tax=Candidatus Hakubella thermalkaliphila TaxID=2754717 RepID=A0A6V8NRE1_9ACTN|nr:hypothetical protein HKBW3S06_01166 [Candidatus Hakubella thermalkaliphila]
MVLITFKIQGAGLQVFDLQGEVMGRILEGQKIWVNSKQNRFKSKLYFVTYAYRRGVPAKLKVGFLPKFFFKNLGGIKIIKKEGKPMKNYLVLLGIFVLILGFISPSTISAEDSDGRIGQELGPEGSPTALELAEAILTPGTAPFLVSASRTGVAGQFEVYTASLQGFPTSGSSWALISTGRACSIAGVATTFYSYDTGGPTSPPYSHRGEPSYDIATLTLTLSVPAGVTTLSFDWKFGTEENPDNIGSYLDWASAIVTTSVGSSNILLFPDGKPVDVDNAIPFSNKVTGSSLKPLPPYPLPNDVVYNAATGLYKATFNVAPFVGETIRIDFQIADEFDETYDSALFIDNLNIDLPAPAPEPAPAPAPVDEQPLTYYRKTNSGFVTLLYNRVLRRAPEPKGLDGWVAGLEGGALTGADLVNHFIFSEECQYIISDYTNEEFITFLYKALFKRKPDSEGYTAWLAHMAAGMTREEVVGGFTDSEEFVNLCKEFGIRVK